MKNTNNKEGGFTLIETLIAMIILTFGLLATAQLLAAAIGGSTLARSKGSAAVVAQDKLDFLADAYRQNPDGTDLTLGAHGPEQVQVTNPVDGVAMNRYNVQWTVTAVPDPRAGKVIQAKQVTVTATPIGAGTNVNNQPLLNKVVSITEIFTPKTTP